MQFRLPIVGISIIITGLLSACIAPNKPNDQQNSLSSMQASTQQRQNAPLVATKCDEVGKAYNKVQLALPGADGTMDRVRIGATGYGAPPKNYYPPAQRRLMTIRAAKIDAYRSLAEVVGGLHIWGGTAIADMVIERDRYRVFVDSYVRGAHIISVDELEDGTYQTVVELDIGQRFLWQVLNYIDPAMDKQCFEQAQNGTYTYYGYGNVSPSFYYSE